MTKTFSTDIVIFGGGIAGLWLLNRLTAEGWQAILLERRQLGQGQSVASQGIIHGGLKYALHGKLSRAAEAIAAMPGRWRDCLEGRGDVDLRGCRVLSDSYYMWSTAGYRSRLKTFLGSKALRGRIEAVPESEYPPFFRDAGYAGSLYQLPDFVLDTASLLEKLRSNCAERIFRLPSEDYSFSSHGDAVRIHCGDYGEGVCLAAKRVVFCAGEGNEQLITKAGISAVKMQRRPLHMVFLKKTDLPPVYVHCIGESLSLTPALTLTSHGDSGGEPAQRQTIWYLGGELAEAGVERDPTRQIQAAGQLLRRLFPRADLEGAQWGSFLVNRAEACLAGAHRPDDAFLYTEGRFSVGWPTKFTLSPNLADQLVADLVTAGISKSGTQSEGARGAADESTAGAENGTGSNRKDGDAGVLRSLFPAPSITPAPWSSAHE